MKKIGSTEQFDQFIAESPLVIIKFETTWCPDCRRVEKAFAEYAEAHQADAAFAELNADEVREVAERFDVKGIPSFLCFKGGELVDRLYSRDAKTAQQVTGFADKVLKEQAIVGA